MSVRIRLRRMGAKKRAHFRVVVADKRSPRDGRFLDSIGIYDPVVDPSKIRIDREKALKWLNEGAVPTDAARSLLSKVGIWQEFKTGVRPSEEEIAGRAGAKETPATEKQAAPVELEEEGEPGPEEDVEEVEEVEEPEAEEEPAPTPAEPAQREAPEPTVETEPDAGEDDEEEEAEDDEGEGDEEEDDEEEDDEDDEEEDDEEDEK